MCTPVPFRLGIAICALVLFLGCNSTTTEPGSPVDAAAGLDESVAPGLPAIDASVRSGFYPLQLGDRWSYDRTFSFQVIPASGEAESPQVLHSTIAAEIVGYEDMFGRRYTVQENREVEDGGFSDLSWYRFRQDISGLYEADVSIHQPPVLVVPNDDRRRREVGYAKAENSTRTLQSCLLATNVMLDQSPYRELLEQHLARHAAIREVVGQLLVSRGVAGPPGGVLSDEITRLRYPLSQGATWFIREQPLFKSTVEGPDRLDLPVGLRNAFRVRITPPGSGDNDEVFLWYSRCGRLKFYAHIESTGVIPAGNVITLVSTDEEVLTNIDVTGRDGCGRP